MHFPSIKLFSSNSPWKYLTVEPAVFVYFSTNILVESLNSYLYLHKACRFNTTSEPNLDTPCDEKKGILFVSMTNSVYQYVVYTMMFLYATFISCWSDYAGRKRTPLIIVPILGQLIQTVVNTFHSYFWYWPPTAAVISDTLLKCAFGGPILMLLGAQIYLCDITTLENRTSRIGIFTALKIICLPVGSGAAGFLIHQLGFFHSYLLCFLLTTLSLLFAFIFISDVSVQVEKLPIYTLFNPMQIFDAFKVIFGKKPGRKRMIVVLLVATHVIMWFTSEGEKSVIPLYLRYRFKWDEKTYSVFYVYKFIGLIIGTVFCSIILSAYLKVHDGLIGVFAGFWDTLTVIAYLFADQNWHLYAIPLLDIFHGVAISICDSFLSKFFQSNEFGRMNSILNAFSLLVPICNPVYNQVFQYTIDTFPSAFFFISIVNNLIVCTLYGAAYYFSRNESKQSLTDQPNEKFTPKIFEF